MSEYTDVTVLLDRSGSMASIKSAMESAFGEFVQQHKAVPSTRLSLIQFDTANPQEVVYSAKPIAEVPGLNLQPNGGTPLLDALCRAIDGTGKRLAEMTDVARPDQVLFVIITDGQENASREFKRQDVHDRITRQADVYKWQFVYLGANQDAIKEAADFGIAAANAMNYHPSAAGVRGMSNAVAENSLKYARRQSSRVEAFDDTQRKQADTKPS